MSADNGIYYRQIDGLWYVMHGFASDEYTDAHFVENGRKHDALDECMLCAHDLAEEQTKLEYGIVHSPSPPKPDREVIAQLKQRVIDLELELTNAKEETSGKCRG